MEVELCVRGIKEKEKRLNNGRLWRTVKLCVRGIITLPHSFLCDIVYMHLFHVLYYGSVMTLHLLYYIYYI